MDKITDFDRDGFSVRKRVNRVNRVIKAELCQNVAETFFYPLLKVGSFSR